MNDDTIFDTDWWATEGSASTYDYDTFKINFKFGEETTFEFIPNSDGNQIGRWLPDEPLPDNIFHNKSFYLSQLNLIDDGTPSGVDKQVGGKYTNQGQVSTGKSNSPGSMLKIQVDTGGTIYRIRGASNFQTQKTLM